MNKIGQAQRYEAPAGMPVQVLLTESYAPARKELCVLLANQGFQTVTEVPDNWNAVRLAKEFRPDIAILDAASKFLESIKAAGEILRWNRKAKVILLSLHSESQYALFALQAGIRGYVLKTRAAADLGHAIHEVSQGGIYLSSGISSYPIEAYLLGIE